MSFLKNKKKISIGIGFFLIILIFTISIYIINSYKNKANKNLNTLESLIEAGDYSDAYSYYEKNSDKYTAFGYDKKLKEEIDLLLENENNKYNEGISLLSNNKDGDYLIVKDYFNSYLNNYSFLDNDNINKAKEIISLIDEYHEKLSEYNEINNYLELYDSNISLLNTIEGYIGSLDAFHASIGGAISGMDYASALNAYNTWNNNNGYYYSMNNNISSISNSINNCVLSEGDLGIVYSYISNGISPGEYMNSVLGVLSGYKDEIKNGTLDTSVVDGGTVSSFLKVYGGYDDYKSNVLSLINSKKEYLLSCQNNANVKQEELNKIKEQLNNI